MSSDSIDQTKIHSARQLAEKKKHNVKRKTYEGTKIRKDFPGAWLFVDQVFPKKRYSEERRVEEANELIHWHRQNGTLNTLKSTYRGDFYKPEPGSPEEDVYWGDFYDNTNIEGAFKTERAIRDLRKPLYDADRKVEAAGEAIKDNYKKAKAQQYRWKRRLKQINEETIQIVERLDMIMPSAMIPIMTDFDTGGFDIENDRGDTAAPMDFIDEEEVYNHEVQVWEQSIMDSHTFAEVQQLVRDRDRLTSLNTQKSDIFRKMDGWENQQAEIETALMEDLMDAQRERDEVAEKVKGLQQKRWTNDPDLKALMKIRNALAHNAEGDAIDRMIDAHLQRSKVDEDYRNKTMRFYDGTPFEAMIKDRVGQRNQISSVQFDEYGEPLIREGDTNIAAREVAKVTDVTRGTLYTGTITVPGHSTVEVDLDTLTAQNDADISKAREITLKTDALRNQMLEEQQEQRARDTITMRTLANIGKMLPSQMLNAHKGLPRNAGPALRHDMEKLAEKKIATAKNRLCIAPPKYVGDRALEHCRRHIALRTGRWLPFDFVIDVVTHYNRNNYVCQVVTHEYNLPCVLSLGIDRKGNFAGKLRVRTGFFLRPDLWTLEFEAEHCNVDLDDEDNYPVPSLIEEHHRMVGLLDLPEDVSRLLNYGNLKAA